MVKYPENAEGALISHTIKNEIFAFFHLRGEDSSLPESIQKTNSYYISIK